MKRLVLVSSGHGYGAGLHHSMLPLFLLLIVAEAAWIVLGLGRSYPWQQLLSTIGVLILQLVAKLAQPLLLGSVLWAIWSHRFLTVHLPGPAAFALGFIGVEFSYYWAHRLAHTWRWLWATHSVHHSSEHMNLSAALRLGVGNALAGEWLFYTPLILLGFAPPIVFGLLGLNLTYQFFLHTELIPKLGPIEWLFNTPSHHRVHHASNRELLDKNFGGVLIVFDRLFGTLAAESESIPLKYGLFKECRGSNPITIAFAGWWSLITSPWRQARLRG